MRALRLLALLAAGLLGAAVLAAWIGPGFLNWDRYRDRIAALASEAIGRPVRIDGPVSLALLPHPELIAEAVGIGGAEGSFTAAALRLRVGLGPLIAGHLDARELVLRGAELRLPWPLVPGAAPPFRPGWMQRLSARVEDSRLRIGGLAFTGIDARFQASGPGGGYRVDGTAGFAGRRWAVGLRLTASGPDGAAGLDVTIDEADAASPTAGSFAGQITGEGTLAGHVAAHGPNLAVLLPAPHVAFSGDGRLTVADGLAAADDLSLQIGGAPARGAVALRLTPALRLDMALAASRLDLDAWLPVLAGLPPAYPVGLDLSAEAADLRGALLRRLRAAFDLEGGAIGLREASAILPGEAALTLSGTLPAAGPFAGRMHLAAPDLRTTLGWAVRAGFAPALPAGEVLRRADLAGAVEAGAGVLTLSGLTGSVDGQSLTGELALGTASPFRLRARLALDRLELDGWVPERWVLEPSGLALPRLQTDLALRAGVARWRGRDIADFVLDAAVQGEGAVLRRLSGTAAGVHASLSGRLGADGRIAAGLLDATARSAAPLAALLPAGWRAAPALWNGPATLHAAAEGPPGALALQLALDLADARLEATPVLDLERRSWAGGLTLRHPGAARLLASAGLPGAQAWLGEGSFAVAGQGSGGPGRLALDRLELSAGLLHCKGELAWDASAPTPRLTGRLAADLLPVPLPDPHATDPLPLGWLRGWSAALRLEAAQVAAGPTTLLHRMAAALSLEEGRLRLDHLSGVLAGGALAGNALLDVQADPPALSASAALAGARLSGPVTELPIDLVAGQLDASLRLAAAGHSPAALLAGLGGTMRLTAREGSLSGFDLGAVNVALQAPPETGEATTAAALTAALAGGTTGFDRLGLTLEGAHGRLLLSGAGLDGPSGQATLGGEVDLASATLDLRAVLRPDRAGLPAVALHVAGPLQAPQRVPELAEALRWRSRAAATD